VKKFGKPDNVGDCNNFQLANESLKTNIFLQSDSLTENTHNLGQNAECTKCYNAMRTKVTLSIQTNKLTHASLPFAQTSEPVVPAFLACN